MAGGPFEVIAPAWRACPRCGSGCWRVLGAVEAWRCPWSECGWQSAEATAPAPDQPSSASTAAILPQRPEEGTKVPSAVRRTDTGHVLPDHPAGAEVIHQSQIDEGQVTTRISQPRTEAGDGERLARGSADHKIN